MTSVRIQGLVKNFGAFQAVKNLDLEVEQGELVVLLGPSGCGKTTTLRCIAGLEDIDGGRILIGEETVSTADHSVPPEKRSIGMVFQSYAVWPHMTILENVAFGLKIKHVGKDEIRQRVEKVLELVGLGGYGERSVSQLSGGQQQRVALARAIVLEPRVLLFDEPLSNLDAKLRERMRFELRSLQKRLGITAIYVTHDQQEAMAIADRVVLMNGGKIEQQGTPAQIYNHPVTRFAAEFIGLTNILEGKVVSTNPTKIALAGGLVFGTDQSGLQVGDDVEVICRPENVALLSAPSDAPNTYPGRVNNVFFLGNLSEAYVDVAGVLIRCQSSPPVLLPQDKQVWVRMAPEQAVVLRRRKAA
jgi:ABC-type Fe3+/spermidine/putrescine transport system ATPase subunit